MAQLNDLLVTGSSRFLNPINGNARNGIYYVKGTQTAATGSWTGNIPIPALYDGLTIMYYLPYAGSGNATLNLTLSNGTTTGAKNCYYSTSRLTTHYSAGQNVVMTYHPAGSISVNGTATSDDRWIVTADYDSDYILPYTWTAPGTAEKYISGSYLYADLTKTWFMFNLIYANTYAGALKLNVNGNGAKPLYINGTVSSSSNYTMPRGTYLVYYDGTNYYVRTDGKITGDLTGNAATATYATSAGSAAPTSGSTYYIQNNVGSSRSTATSGSWMSMLNSSQTGSPTLPTSSKWWTVLSADCWNSAPKNWVSQLALPTQETSGVWWRRNDSGGTSIDSSTWHRLSEGDSDGNAKVANKLGTSTVGGTTTPIYLNAGTPTALSYTIAKSVPSDAVFTDHYAWSDITGKPITLAANSSALNTNGWKTLGGRSSGAKLTVSYASSSPATWNSESYSATVLFGASDTKGFLDCGYNTPIVTFGGGSVGSSTDDNPKWYWKFSGTSGKTYTLPSNSCTLGTSNLALGTTSTTALKGDTKYAGASSAGGSATSAAKLDTSTAGSATQPCYFANGVPSACTYSLNKTVPSGAVFTDNNVTQTNTTSATHYRVLLSGTADDTNRTEGVNKSVNLQFDPAISNGTSIGYQFKDGTRGDWATDQACGLLDIAGLSSMNIRLCGDGTVAAEKIICHSMYTYDISSQYTFSKSSGNWTISAIEAHRTGNVVNLAVTFKGNGSAVSAGGNGFVGTRTAGPLPLMVARGISFLSSGGIVFQLDIAGNVYARVIGSSVTLASTGTNTISTVFMVND